jgi:hypothetical protein
LSSGSDHDEQRLIVLLCNAPAWTCLHLPLNWSHLGSSGLFFLSFSTFLSTCAKSFDNWAQNKPGSVPRLFTMAANISRPQEMNASPHHAKVKVRVQLADNLVVAGNSIGGKIEVESKADKGLSLGVIKAELFAIEGMSHISSYKLMYLINETTAFRTHVSRSLRYVDIHPFCTALSG